ncbi:NAD(P)/FAD-dependent oxidoreductase [Ktedonobacter racemifer]|uniref:FAD-dependent pyridine nucleotide-disulfide oxidoreductase n=1 Tax=Ktedonobacter racemifer DSM 44963 TaxID=485913 RepID=D6TRE8_KTERA|nr:FAD-dependent oxidoreductase [Ktedonobacter racemifer]EFH87847.1 FAD-dependent pyridine nucleotide-disulfide oxidoreductase [Ktedonobacter racemifer DSM 44963]
MDRADIVIVGNGIAGLTAAVEARKHAPEKQIVMITEQVHPTINTPALKQYATGRLTREQLLAYPVGTERQEHIRIVTTRVEEIHANSKYLALADKRAFGYDKLLIATGSAPLSLPETMPGRHFDGVLTLHRLQDYLDLRRRLPEVREAVVVGGGVHAIETVMGLLHWGIRVHWLIRGSTFMGRTLDQEASGLILEGIRRAGASVHTETEAIGVVGRVGAVVGVITNQQQMLPCQMVLICTGTKPAETLARRSTIPIEFQNGIVVDDIMQTNVANIFAAGDVAALPNPQTGQHAPRAQWYAAVLQGRLAGVMLAGREDLAKQPLGIAWHATHVGDLSMLTVGDPLAEGSGIEVLKDKSQGGYRRLAIAGERLVGYLSLGQSQPDSLAVKRIIEEGHSVQGITRALLKGNFDARQYLSQMSSQTARGMLTGKQSAIKVKKQEAISFPQPGQSGPLILPTRTTGPIRHVQPVAKDKTSGERETSPLAPLANAENLRVPDRVRATNTGEVESVFIAQHGTRTTRPGGTREGERSRNTPTPSSSLENHGQSEIDPFRGNLPALTPSLVGLPEEVNAFSGNLPQPRPSMIWEEELDAFSGKLPRLEASKPAPKDTRKATGENLQPGTKQSRPRNLLSYAQRDKQPAPPEAKQVDTSTGTARTFWSYAKPGDHKKGR